VLKELPMFRRTWWNGVVSASGFSVKLRRPHNIEYRENGKLLIAYMDMLRGTPAIDIDSSSIKNWHPPFHKEQISPEKKQQILDNICSALTFSGLTYVIR
jgi:hypothetical protein